MAARATMLRVLVALVVGVLLLVVGLPREAGAAVSGSGSTLTAPRSVLADAADASVDMVAPHAVEADDWAGRPASADPLPHLLRCLSGSAFVPRGRAVVRARASAPPDRPPRLA
ncbi:hypothetical protein [Methylobacterium sp. E-016]|uniref:hypothetical protein n=1 Tax=Methylobacterium sp. E-016 TaxID=2836556 RepID=UPI001FBB22AF|nr:hypothetical protein [Methylobacterium sp. E-016]